MTNLELEYEVAGGFVRIIFKRPMIIGSDRDDSRNNSVSDSRNGYVNGDVNGDVTSLKGVLKDIYLIVLNNPGIKIAQVAELRGKCKHSIAS